jgi:glucan-binding YG repeat protein
MTKTISRTISKPLSKALIIALLACFIMIPTSVETHADVLDEPSTYSIVGYRDGMCVLSACVYMIRRSLIMMGSSAWDQVTLESARKVMTTNGVEYMKWNFTYTVDGVTFTIKSGNHTRDSLINYLASHPEGMVVHNGSHAILATSYDGNFHCVDSANWGAGIQNYGSSMSYDHGSCWYIASVSGVPKSAGYEETDENGNRIYVKNGERVTGFYDLSYDGNKTSIPVYYNENGEMQLGWFTVDGNTYYANEISGEIQKNCEFNIDGKWYFFDEDGVRKTGYVIFSDKESYYDEEDGHLINTWVKGVDEKKQEVIADGGATLKGTDKSVDGSISFKLPAWKNNKLGLV